MAGTNTIVGSVNLQSKDHEELLNTIDGLRSLGISRYVDLPQIIVCGDQSSGKSSVLEAISGVQFPVKDTLCTRVATELILRRSPVIGGSISIVPSSDRVEDEKTRLQQWKATEFSLGDLPAVLEEAMVAMDIDGSLKNFGRDVLRVEVTGPDQPHLTLVDLPGLFHAGTKEQSELEADMVKELVISYMKNPRSVVLAVISASNDINNQIVLSHTQKIDPKGMRTLGIITKPDCLPVGSASEEKYYKLAGNQDVVFQLGWHVLKNRDYAHRHSSATARDKAEEEFFSQGLWTSMSKAKLGVASLKPRLSAVLREQILTHLPSLIADVRAGIAESRAALGKLGDSRVSTREQRSYLLHLSERFTSIMKDAVSGRYEDPFFAVADTQSKFARRLRARVQKFLTDFRDEVRLGGCYKPAGDEASYIDHVRQLMLYNRGRELSGTFNPQIIGELFHEQSKPWKEIAIQFAELLFSAVVQTVTILLKYLTDETTFSKLMRHLINPAINDIKGKLDQMLRTILARFQYGHPITYNHYLIENVQKARERRLAKQLESKIKHFFHRETINNKITIEARTEINVNEMASKLARTSEVDMEKFAAMEAIDMTDAYYKVSGKTFIDEFSSLPIEQVLLQEVVDIFSINVVGTLEDDVIRRVASEDEDTQAERDRALSKKKVLEQTLRTLNHLDNGQGASASLRNTNVAAAARTSKKRARKTSEEATLSEDGETLTDDEDLRHKRPTIPLLSSSDCEVIDTRPVEKKAPQQKTTTVFGAPPFTGFFDGESFRVFRK